MPDTSKSGLSDEAADIRDHPDWSDGDFTLVSADGWRFKVLSHHLLSSSPVFRDAVSCASANSTTSARLESKITLTDNVIERRDVIERYLLLLVHCMIGDFPAHRDELAPRKESPGSETGGNGQSPTLNMQQEPASSAAPVKARDEILQNKQESPHEGTRRWEDLSQAEQVEVYAHLIEFLRKWGCDSSLRVLRLELMAGLWVDHVQDERTHNFTAADTLLLGAAADDTALCQRALMAPAFDFLPDQFWNLCPRAYLRAIVFALDKSRTRMENGADDPKALQVSLSKDFLETLKKWWLAGSGRAGKE